MSPTGSRVRLRLVVGPVCAVGLAAVVAAAASFAGEPHSGTTLLSLLGLLVACTVAERFPVPLDGTETGGVSLSFVFVLSSLLLFGWSAGVLVGFTAVAVMHLIEHRPPIRIAYNSAVFALAAAAAGWSMRPIADDGAGSLAARVGVSTFVDHWVNLLLIAAVVSASQGKSFLPVLRANLRGTTVPFALMASAALMLVVLWERSPLLSIALVGPLLTISLYQRSTHNALRAMKLALTDPLTGLGNHRAFHERLQRELLHAEEDGTPLTLCLLDIDDFKRINDRHGHPVGDHVLGRVADRLRRDGEAFRLGGDEFALLLPAHDEARACPAAEAILARVGELELDPVGSVAFSAGVATFPGRGVRRDDLIRLADSALYWAKEHGKNRVHAYRPDVVELAQLRRAATGADRALRYRAAASLARAVDARDTYTGAHSQRVADLAGRIAVALGIDSEQAELTRLAASLHDLGKLAVPEEILRKPGPLTAPERLVLERHPQIGFRMLDSLGIDPVAEWVLHHHERWDGAGYPDGLAGETIPLGARIVFVADAYDAMTSDRAYRARLANEDAVAELERCAGSQFDPDVVAALAGELGLAPLAEPALAS